MADKKRTWSAFKNQMKAKKLKILAAQRYKNRKTQKFWTKCKIIRGSWVRHLSRWRVDNRRHQRRMWKALCYGRIVMFSKRPRTVVYVSGAHCWPKSFPCAIRQWNVKIEEAWQSYHQPIHVSSVPSTLVSDHDAQHSNPEKSYPKILSVSHMPKLGKTLKSDAVGNVLEIYSFSMESMKILCSVGVGFAQHIKL